MSDPKTNTTTSASPSAPANPAPAPAKPTIPTLTSANAAPKPTPEIDSRDPWEGVEAKPLTAPAFDQIKKKNPNIEIRWVNRACGTVTPQLRYEQMLAMGWVPATEADVVPPPGCLKDGHIQTYDVILMKIDRKTLLAAMKFNNERVNKAVRRGGQVAGANEQLRKGFAEAGVPSKSYRGKVEVFVPGTKELEQMDRS